MGLATEEEWENDPELREMRREFVASFLGRKLAIEALCPALRRERPGSEAHGEALKAVVFVAHKLSGAAETYGFPMLTQACTAFEDCFGELEHEPRDPVFAVESALLLVEMLGRTQALGKDLKEFSEDPRFARLRKTARNAD